MSIPLSPTGGKGDTYRQVDKQGYDRAWIRCFGEKCRDCKGRGYKTSNQIINDDGDVGEFTDICINCSGIGKIDPKERR